MTEKAKTLLQRLAAVQAEVDYIQKEKKQGMRYSIVSHDAVTAKVRPLMVKHGVLYYPTEMVMGQVGNRTEMQMYVRFVNVDDRDDSIAVATAGYGIDDQDKGPGKAISYAVKYALLKTLGLESGDDPDEDQETKHNDNQLLAFIAQVQKAKTVDELSAIFNAHREDIDTLKKSFPAQVMQARQQFEMKLRQLKASTVKED